MKCSVVFAILLVVDVLMVNSGIYYEIREMQ